jgi:hypothetical protein
MERYVLAEGEIVASSSCSQAAQAVCSAQVIIIGEA